MTLQAPPKKPRRDLRRTGHHQHKKKHFHKTYWPYLPMLAIFGLGLLFNAMWPAYKSVLGYATDMSAARLLTDTNQQRANNGLATLSLNQKLTNAAEAKAEDMAAKDYWSHDTPDGKTPWSFILAAGYDYQTAGENLAYGFGSADATMTAWMNSPEHRANILNNTYTDVGFAFINIPNYQNSGPETLVVAEYGSLQPGAETVPSASQPAATSSSGGAPTPATQLVVTQPKPTQKVTVSSHAHKHKKVSPQNNPKSDTVTPATVANSKPQSQQISRIQLVANGKALWSLSVTLIILVVALALLIIRHGFAWHRYLVRGERFALKHPAFDFAALAIVMIAFVLSHTAGFIQ